MDTKDSLTIGDKLVEWGWGTVIMVLSGIVIYGGYSLIVVVKKLYSSNQTIQAERLSLCRHSLAELEESIKNTQTNIEALVKKLGGSNKEIELLKESLDTLSSSLAMCKTELERCRSNNV